MNGYLLDTNVVSELRKSKPHGGVLAWMSELPESQIFISAVTMGELQLGVERVRKHDASKAEEIERWVGGVADSGSVLPMDSNCFREWARLTAEHPAQLLEDAMIAATARVHGLTVATRNEKDFARLRCELVNPFQFRK
ncbi:MAG TPA: type II toxin-antitoxin system VapC family toxin [Candidatus Acidoferrales bacterium]|nr:type II toxin-antitoxin system VapC family toxin [Candidatus Acidoferrales bacterium]